MWFSWLSCPCLRGLVTGCGIGLSHQSLHVPLTPDVLLASTAPVRLLEVSTSAGKPTAIWLCFADRGESKETEDLLLSEPCAENQAFVFPESECSELGPGAPSPTAKFDVNSVTQRSVGASSGTDICAPDSPLQPACHKHM